MHTMIDTATAIYAPLNSFEYHDDKSKKFFEKKFRM